jgi:IclR family KDG regulon transcriptional repressor
MSYREKNPNIRKYTTDSSKSSTVSTSLHRATNILSCLSNGINTISDIASYCKYSISTVHRLLQTLKELNWVVQDNNNRMYYLGPLITQLASNHNAAHKYLIMHSLREMMRLSDVTEETVNLGIMIQLHYVLLYDIPSQHDLRIIEESKRLGPLYIGATAKALLSLLGDEELRTSLKHIKFDYVTENTETDKKVLLAQIMEVRQQGYCVTYGERIPGAVCISAPIRNYICPAALSIVGPENRLKLRVNGVISELKGSAERISADIIKANMEKEVVYDEMNKLLLERTEAFKGGTVKQ